MPLPYRGSAILAVLVVFLETSILSAAPPTLTQLFPAGGQRGQTVTVTASGSFSPWPVQAWCNSKEITITCTKDSGKLEVTVGENAIPGIYWLRLFNKDGASELRPFFVSNLPEVVEKEPNDDSKKPHALPHSAVVNGKLERAGDVDAFAISARKGQTLVASLEAFANLRSPMDGVLQVVSTEGFTLAQNHDFHDMDPFIAFPVPKDGDYIVRVFAFPSKADSSIKFAGGDKFIYRLTLTTGGYAEYAFPLAIRLSDKTPVELVGWNVPDVAKKVVPVQHDEAEARAFHPLMANSASVLLERHPTTVKQAPATRAKPQAIALPATISGRLDNAGDVDVFQFSAKKADKLSFQVEARALHFPLDAILKLTDSQGKTLMEASSSKLNLDPTLNYTVPADGPYRIELRDLHGQGGPRHVYRLRALYAEPDFDLSVPTDRITMNPGKPASVAVTINRKNGFAKDVTLSVEGLPMGLKAEPVTIRATDKMATLKLTAEAGGTAGALRLVGQIPEGVVRYATAPGVEPGWKTDHLWVTAVSTK